MSEVLIWVIAAVVLVAVVVIVAVVVMRKREDQDPEPIVDPPYGRRGVDDPTVDDPQLAPGEQPRGARFVEDPDAMRNPTIDGDPPGQSIPRSFPPPGPPRE